MEKEDTDVIRPFKIWDCNRTIRKGTVALTYEELIAKAKQKLGIQRGEPVKLVLESDGTQIDNGEYFRTLPANVILLLIRENEQWCPAGVNALRAAISIIPDIVYETIYALNLHNETPSWKIMDNKGRVTVVLHWDQKHPPSSPSRQAVSFGSAPSIEISPVQNDSLSSIYVRTSFDQLSSSDQIANCRNEFSPNNTPKPCIVTSTRNNQTPQITVINNDENETKPISIASSYGVHYNQQNQKQNLQHQHYRNLNQSQQQQTQQQQQQQLPYSKNLNRQHLCRQGSSSIDSTGPVHMHTSECGTSFLHRPIKLNSPTKDYTRPIECDFHCCALHEEGRTIAVQKNIATSPIREIHTSQSSSSPTPFQPQSSLKSTGNKSNAHVHFKVDDEQIKLEKSKSPSNLHESSESETENTIMEDEIITSEKFLLLIDQLSVDQKKHLSIKDIGIILERLNSKILDVERLERDSDNEDCFNWTIKAVIRGDFLREMGVIYNGNYYTIAEHPGYIEENKVVLENDDDNEDEDDDDDDQNAKSVDDGSNKRVK